MPTGLNSSKNGQAKTRAEIKGFFKNGDLPGEDDFSDLIDSMVNIRDDKYYRNGVDGLKFLSVSNNRFLTFYNNETDKACLEVKYDKITGNDSLEFEGVPGRKIVAEAPDESLERNYKKEQEGGNTEQEENNEIDETNNSFFFHLDGRLGVGKRSPQNTRLSVNGFAAMNGRLGKIGVIRANKTWQPILEGAVDDCQAFEIVARTGVGGSGKFGMLHAIALSTYGNSKNKIRKTHAYFGPFWNKINLRWKGSTHGYTLEMRTNSNYDFKPTEKEDGQVFVYYSITSLWDDKNIVPEKYFKTHVTKEKYESAPPVVEEKKEKKPESAESAAAKKGLAKWFGGLKKSYKI